MKRIMILGQPGSGKSTLARQVGEALDLPVVHVDQIHWMSGWVERAQEDKVAMALAEQAKSEWVFEGGLAETKDNRLSRADTLIVLDLPLILRAWRVFIRTLRHYGRSRPDMPDGCPERFSLEFWGWIWNTRHTARAANYQWADTARQMGKPVHILRSPRQVRQFLQTLDATAQNGQ